MFISSVPPGRLLALSHMNLNARCQSHHPCLLTASGTLFTDHSQCLSRLPHPHLPVGILHISHIVHLYISTPLFVGMPCPFLLAPIQAHLTSSFSTKTLSASLQTEATVFIWILVTFYLLQPLYLFCFTIASFVFEYLS